MEPPRGSCRPAQGGARPPDLASQRSCKRPRAHHLASQGGRLRRQPRPPAYAARRGHRPRASRATTGKPRPHLIHSRKPARSATPKPRSSYKLPQKTLPDTKRQFGKPECRFRKGPIFTRHSPLVARHSFVSRRSPLSTRHLCGADSKRQFGTLRIPYFETKPPGQRVVATHRPPGARQEKKRQEASPGPFVSFTKGWLDLKPRVAIEHPGTGDC